MTRWIVAVLSVAVLGVCLGVSTIAAPPLPQTAQSNATTEWLLERGTEDGVDYIAVTATNSGTDVALQLVCTVDASATITLYGETGSDTTADDTVAITTYVAGRPVRKDQWEQSVEDGDVLIFDLSGKSAFDLITVLSQEAAGDIRFEVPGPQGVARYAFDLGKGAEGRSVLAAACASWRAGADL